MHLACCAYEWAGLSLPSAEWELEVASFKMAPYYQKHQVASGIDIAHFVLVKGLEIHSGTWQLTPGCRHALHAFGPFM